MAPPRRLVQLVETFGRNLHAYRSGRYNETQVRREFVDPLFKTLGWDMDNERGYAEAYKDVVHEDAIQIGGAHKAPDYCFRIGGTAEVDDAFLAEIESWRDALARNFALRNPQLSQRELNFAVQRTIDRIIFLRICEDRGIEPYARLQALLNTDRLYRRLFELFERADERYNSGLFHFQPEPDRPEEPDRLTILDPACGSGSFLLGAYQKLLDWHRDYYLAHNRHTHARAKRIYQGRGGHWRLTTAERKRILLNSIYGVDIDPQAVEVTKLSLLLKVLEGESGEALDTQLKLFHQRALPDLASNIKCGNSLVGPDFYHGERQGQLFDEDEVLRVNAFDWHTEFPRIFRGRNPGFHAVIGNPPWGAVFEGDEKRYLRNHYTLNVGKFESYIFFLEAASGLLNRKGVLGFVVPSYWISRSQTDPLRAYLCETLRPQSLIVLPENVFRGVKMDCCLLVVGQGRNTKVRVAEIPKAELPECSSAGALVQRCREAPLAVWNERPVLRFNPRIADDDVAVIAKAERNSIPLGETVDITQGLTLYRRSTLTKKFGRKKAEEIVANRLFHSDHKKDHTFKKELLGRDVARYKATWNGQSWVSYGPWLAHMVDEKFFQGPRLVIQKLRNPTLKRRLIVGYLDDDETYSAGVVLNAIPKAASGQRYDLLYLMALLNSALLNHWYRKCVLDVSIRVVDLRRVPIRTIDFEDEGQAGKHSRLVELARRMIDLVENLPTTRTAHHRSAIQRQIAATDAEIDRLVYELYGLTDEEIAIVEEAADAR